MNSSVFFFLSAVLVFSIVDGQQNCPLRPCEGNMCCSGIFGLQLRCYSPSAESGRCDTKGECPVCEKGLKCESGICTKDRTLPPTETTNPETPQPPTTQSPTTPDMTTPSQTTPSVTTPSPTTPDVPVQ